MATPSSSLVRSAQIRCVLRSSLLPPSAYDMLYFAPQQAHFLRNREPVRAPRSVMIVGDAVSRTAPGLSTAAITTLAMWSGGLPSHSTHSLMCGTRTSVPGSRSSAAAGSSSFVPRIFSSTSRMAAGRLVVAEVGCQDPESRFLQR